MKQDCFVTRQDDVFTYHSNVGQVSTTLYDMLSASNAFSQQLEKVNAACAFVSHLVHPDNSKAALDEYLLRGLSGVLELISESTATLLQDRCTEKRVFGLVDTNSVKPMIV